MATTSVPVGNKFYAVGDVLVGVDSARFAAKILKEVYIPKNGEYVYIYQYGRILNNKFTPDLFTGQADIGMGGGKYLTTGYGHLWSADHENITPGDILVDQDGAYFFVQEEGTIWRLSTGTNASRHYWTNNMNRVFKQVLTASQDNFSEHIKLA